MQEYPEALLPKSSYKLKIDLSSASLETLTLIRRSLVGEDETTTELGTVRSHAFIELGKEHLFYNLSFNLEGVFRKEHLVFILDRERGGQYWSSKDSIPSRDKIVFSLHPNPCAIYLKVASVYEKPYNYSKKKHDGKIQSFLGYCTVVHKPLEGNYWHFEIEVIDESNARISPNDKEWKKEAAMNFLESYLKVHLTTKHVMSSIPEELYLEHYT